MKLFQWCIGILGSLALCTNWAQASENPLVAKLAGCQDSWLDWKDDPVRVNAFTDGLAADFRIDDSGAFHLPRAPTTAFGLPIVQLFPESAGTAVGFSVLVAAPFDAVKARLEQQLKLRLEQCESDDELSSCSHTLSEKRTIIVIANGRGKQAQSLFGCYYLYEK